MSGRVLHVAGYEGKVVAVDHVTDDVVASADTPRSSRRSCMHATSLTLRLSGFHDGTSRCALDLADLPPQGWDFEYLQLEPDRRGLPIFRPVVPVRIAESNLSPIFALVDSGCEHCLAASWLAHELGIDLRDATDTLELGIGGANGDREICRG